MTWQYDQSINPLDYQGFVYQITHKATGRAYIGRKYLQERRKGKKPQASKWQTYWGSCKPLLEQIKLEGEQAFTREIIHWCKTRVETNYRELEEQVKRDVLNARLPDGTRAYWNSNILLRFYAPKE